MPVDRIVYFEDERPTREQVGQVLTSFFGGAAEIRWETDRFFVTLPGVNTFPFNGLGNSREMAEAERYAAPFHVRSIEVYYGSDHCLDVMTRQQDEYTSGIATVIAQMFARYWRGSLEQ